MKDFSEDQNRDYLNQLILQHNKQVPASVTGIIGVAVFLGFMYSREFGIVYLLPLFVFLPLLSVSRLIFRAFYLNRKIKSIQFYLKTLYINIFLTGLCWASIPLIFLPSASSSLQTLTYICLPALAAGAISALTGFKKLTIFYVTSILASLLIGVILYSKFLSIELLFPLVLMYLMLIRSTLQLSHVTDKNLTNALQFKNNERLVRHIINTSVDSIIILDNSANIIDWNQTAENTLGWNKYEVMNRNVHEILNIKSNESFFNDLTALLQESNKERIKNLTITCKSADKIIVQAVLKPILSNNEYIYTLNLHDLTLQIEKDKKIINAEVRSRNLLNLVDTGIIELDIHGCIHFINNTALKILGYQREELLNQSFHEKLQYQDMHQTLSLWQDTAVYELLNSGLRKHLENEIIWHKNGKMLHTSISSVPVYEDNKIFASILSFSDVSESFHERQENKRLLQIREASPDLMMTFSLEGNIYALNKSARDIFGITGEQVNNGIQLKDIFKNPIQLNLILDEAIPTAYTKNFWSGEAQIKTLYGAELYVTQYIMKLQDDANIQYFSMTMTDITEIKQTQESLIQAIKEAESAIKAKSEFLATMSHEIRTPMNGVLGITQLLSETELDAEQKDYLSIITQSGNALLTIINDILDFSKIEAGHLLIQPLEFDLERSVHEICNLLMPKANEKNIDLILDFSADCPSMVKGDAGRIRQVLMNLLGNSIKFTSEGHIIIQVKPVSSIENNQISIYFSVKDTGIGIAKHQQKKLFDSFTQADGSTTRKYGGTGLGLSISKQLVELMGGEIKIDSELGSGANFFFIIDLPVVKNRYHLQHQSLHGKKTLIVDDNLINLKILATQLEHFGMQVTSAENHTRALQVLKQSTSSKDYFDLIIIDYMMPEMDGAELGKTIINDTDIADCPLVIYSSIANKGDARLFEKIGFSGYLTKPALLEILHDTLECILGEYNNQSKGFNGIITKYNILESKSEQISNLNLKGVKVLLAEDNPVNQKVAISFLEKNNLITTVANNGQEAIDLFKQNDFDVVLMDCQMPVKDGYVATKEINEYQKNNKNTVPIIALTANVQKDDQEKCLSVGMQGFIPKPFTTEIFLTTIQNILKKEVSSMDCGKSDENEDMRNTIDLVTFNSLKEIMEEDFDELIPAFFESSRQILDDLKKAQLNQEFEILQRNAHSLKSSSANLGALNLSSMAKELEAQCKSNIVVEEYQLNSIEKEYNKVHQKLLELSSQ